MEYLVDALGLTCPLPVVEAKNQLEKSNSGDIIQVLVDNEIAVQNLCKFAGQKNYAVRWEKQDADHYSVWITKGENKANTLEKVDVSCKVKGTGNVVVVLSSNGMGNGDPDLAKILMKSFLFALTKQDILPQAILLYNGGAHLSCEGSESLEDLRNLENLGVEILTCGTCLDFYHLKEKLAVGHVTNMYEIVEKMEQADKIIRP